MMNRMMKRFLSIVLVCIMLIGMLPVSAFAAEAESTETVATEPVVTEPVVTDPVEEEPSIVAGYLAQLNALQEEANALDASDAALWDNCAAIYNRLMEINAEVVAAKEAGSITDEEYETIYNAIGSVIMVLYSYGYNPYAVAPTAVEPNMGDYNKKNYVAYDVAKTNPGYFGDKGYNDAAKAYVTEVKLGGVAVVQANSNVGNYGSSNANNQGNRVGKTLENYYVGLDKDGRDTNKTLEITPTPGYYVSQVTVACCDGGEPYECGTWEQGKEFTQNFRVSTGGTASLDLPSSAFGHGTDHPGDESPAGEEQYFILIKVAPVPEPLYVAYDYGSIKDYLNADFAASPFAESDEWVTASSANVYGTGGSNETPYTQFMYSYENKTEVGNWKHVTDTVTREAKLAAAAKGYYFTGWKVIYYNNCTSGYVFSNVYSEPDDLVGENQDLRLITHVKLVAQWAPVKLNVVKDVVGLPSDASNSYTINVLKNGAAFNTAELSVSGSGSNSKTYAPVVPATYSVEETGAAKMLQVGGKSYALQTSCSAPVEITAADIVDGTLREITLTVTNTYAEAVSVSGSKIWNDADDQDGIRPNSITVKLLADGEQIDSKTVTAADGWAWNFENLPKLNDAGEEITYTVTEEAVTGYTSSTDGYNLINTHTPELINISGSKSWDDNENQDGIRPASITVNLLANSEKVDSVVVSEETGWAWSFENLPKFKAGEKITYTITEETVTGYTAVVEDFDITNIHKPETISISGEKTWNDGNNQDGIRPASITVNLVVDDKIVASETVTADNGWKYTFSNLPKYSAGKEIIYSVTENAVPGYETIVDGYNITNIHTPTTVKVEGSKTWQDNDNQDGIRPASVTVNLLADGEKVDSVVVSAETGWAWSFENLPEFKAGKKIDYTVSENDVAGYEAIVSGYNITNIHTPATIQISGSKSWNDADNQDGIRPASITVNLLANGVKVDSVVVSEENGWAWSFDNLPEFEAGAEIPYTITEDPVDGYEATIEGYNVINTHVPKTVDLTVTKIWNDADNQDGIRPESITVNLLADGVKIDTVTITAEDGWKTEFTGLPQFNAGKEIAYTVTEEAVDNYESSIEGLEITNTHNPEKTSVSGIKVWVDNDDQDGKRPESITVNLLADGKKVDSVVVSEADKWTFTFTNLDKYKAGKEIDYTVAEEAVAGYESSVEGTTITNSYTPETTTVSGTKNWEDNENQDGVRPTSITINLLADGKEVDEAIVSEEDEWSWSFENLPKYRDGGVEIIYTITEDAVENYTTKVDGFNVTNTYTPESTSVSGSKNWEDNDDQDGIRPESIVINLLADGEQIDSVTVTAEDEWSWTFENLPRYRDQGTAIVYTIAEEPVENYTSNVDGFNVTNSYTPETTEVSGSKTWDDNNDQDGIRPESIVINLLADDKLIDSVTVTAEDDWGWSFENLPKYRNGGVEIVYTITEDAVENYTGNVDGFDVTNTYAPETTVVSGSKTWNDNNDQDGIRPESIVINLLADEEIIDTIRVTEDDDWAWNFENLPKYRDHGELIEYTITEEAVEGYASSVIGYNVTNSYAPATTSVSGSKTWHDNNDQDGIRPDAITINLLADEEVTDTVVVTEEDGWAWTFENLPKYRDGGVEIIYTITEAPVEGYYSNVSGHDVTNAYTPATTSVSGSKTWQDNNDQDGVRPASITINLLADNEVIDTAVVTEADEWAWTFENLPKYRDGGVDVLYTITEDPVEGYASVVSGYDVTNSYTPATTSVSGSKTWDDNNDQDGARPESITINLLADKEVIDTVVVTEEDGWAWTFENLPKYRDGGVEVIYTITEDPVEGYSSVVSGYDVTNSYTPATTSVAGSKTWDDNNDQDGARPESITINLVKNGEVIDSKTVTAADDWAWNFENLPKYENGGDEIVYTITEAAVEDYSTTYDGYNVTNIHTPDQTSVTVTKAWNDSNDQDGLRPDEITVVLLANGEHSGKTLTLNAANHWTDSFIGLDKYAAGEAVVYTVAEVAVEGYKTVITGDQTAGYTITNTHTAATETISGAKTWNDDNDRDGLRPASININLLADGVEIKEAVANAANGWQWSFADLPVYRDGGVKIVYTITEDAVAGYETVVNGFNVTNTHKIDTTSVSGSKTWNDDNDRDGLRPAYITINLLADGVEIKEAAANVANGWQWSFNDLPVYRDGGVKIAYTITEDAVAGYDTVYSGFSVTNTHKIATTEVAGSKTWNDDNDRDGLRPASITINLLADGVEVKEAIVTAANGWQWSFDDLPVYRDGGEKIVYTITEDAVAGYETTVNGFNVTNTYDIDTTTVAGAKTWNDDNNRDGLRPVSITIRLLADGEEINSATVTEMNGWEWSFSGLPVYRDGGEKIVYSIAEDAVAGYETAVNGFNVTNTHNPEEIEISVAKVWNDNDDQDGIRPNDIVVKLIANGAETGKTLVLSEGNDWNGSFADLLKYENGIEIVYTVEELDVAGYESVLSGTQTSGYTFTNIHTPATVAVEGAKTWDDNDNQDGARPESVTINLLKNGEIVDTKVVTEADAWSWSFNDLPKYENHGAEIAYAITEEAVEDYSTIYDGYNVTNIHTPEQTSVTVTKAWDDNNDQDGIRPDEITVVLLANDEQTDKTLTLNADNNWTGSFVGLDVYAAGEAVVYTVAEVAVEGYETVITGDQTAGYTITNAHTSAVVEVSGSKTWDDNDNQDGARPESITINLLKNGEVIDSKVVTEADAWSWSFNDLPKYENHGTEIVYAITENAVEGYSTTYDGYNVTNSYTPAEISITVTKAWADSNDAEGIRPDDVTIKLLANGKDTGLTLVLSEKNNWTGSFTGIAKFANGEEIVYTVDEVKVEGYNTVIKGSMEEGFVVTNSHTYIPQTGDERTPVLWAGMMIVSAMMIVLACFDSKKRRVAK